MRQSYLTRLRQILVESFSEGELRTLCFDLDVDHEDLPGSGKADKARELVDYLDRRDRIHELVRIGKQLRPNEAWEDKVIAVPAVPSVRHALSPQRLRRVYLGAIIVVVVALLAVAGWFVWSRVRLPRTVVTRDGREMVLIPAGKFRFGIEQTLVDMPAYYIDRYPVTNGDYKRFLESEDRPVPDHWPGGEIPAGKEQHPVINISYHEAARYARWAGKRLPTEQEWEKAARGTDGRLWPWGQAFDERLVNSMWKRPADERDTTPVGSYSPGGDSPYGVSDIGHMWEWTSSWYTVGVYRAVRGGPWRNAQEPAAVINRSTETGPAHDLGFRCVSDADKIDDIVKIVLKR